MQKILEKTIKNSIKEKTATLGSKSVLISMGNSKLVVLSNSVPNDMKEEISLEAKKSNVPILRYNGNSVSLGKLSGLQYRVSTISISKITDSEIKTISKEIEL